MSNVSSTSELTTKEIVEQAIQDYHESILPFLNGQVPTIANKFDKANLYSTDEKIVGRWIDGKPLYQKMLTFNKTLCNQGGTDLIDVSSLIIDTLVDCVLMNDDNGKAIINGLEKRIKNGYLNFFNATSEGTYINKAIIQYTKTTDEAIAIGSDTDYSLEEKIVGTDTDGTYIYQKTVNVSGTILDSNAGYGYVADLDVGISNIANIINCEGRNTTNGMAMNFWANKSSVANSINIRCIIVQWTFNQLTLRYTKTS